MTDLFAKLDIELWFSRRLEQHGVCTIFAGVTTPEERRERIRELILVRGCDMTIIGRNPGTRRPETYREAFERAFKEPLEPKRKKA